MIFNNYADALALLGLSLVKLSQASGKVYLTFDDGPVDATLGVLDVLQKANVKATFFINGFHLAGEGDENEDRSLEALKRIVDEGHVLANHGVNHMLHNCCDESGECGAEVCNVIAQWNVQSYQDVDIDAATFAENTDFVARPEYLGEAKTPASLSQYARLPYTNAWRHSEPDGSSLSFLSVDCPCCTSDDLAPWDPAFQDTCSLETPSKSAQLASEVADRLVATEGFEAVFGWDLEWSPESWGDEDPVSTMTSAIDLFNQVLDILDMSGDAFKSNDTVVASRISGEGLRRNIPWASGSYRTEDNFSACAEIAKMRSGKVVLLTHDFLFEDGKRGMGATANLPKLKEIIALVHAQGLEFETMDYYLEERVDISSDGKKATGIWSLLTVSAISAMVMELLL